MNSEGAVIKGAATGFALAAVSCLLIYFCPAHTEPFYTAGSFLASSPILLLIPSDSPDLLSWSVIFFYWVFMGAVFGWLFGKRQRAVRISGIILILGIVLVHGITLHKITDKIGEALAEGIGRIFQTNVLTEK